jgi:hypothetical protein
MARKQFEGMNTRIYNREIKLCKENPLYKLEMLGTAETYVDFLREQEARYAEKPLIAFEREVSYATYAPEGKGIADCLMLGEGWLHIVDYKHGSNPANRVDPDNNPQLMLYALAALDSYKLLYGDSIQNITLCVVQPRLNNIAVWETTTAELRNWGESYVKPRAQQAWEGKGEFSPGEHCKWCKVKAECRARYESYSGLEEFRAALPPTLSDTEVGGVLQRAIALEAWVSDLKVYALTACLEGKDIPGFKAVEGRSNRIITDADAAAAKLQAAGFDPAVLYVRKLETLGNLEGLAGKKQLPGILGELLVKPQGKPTLVPASDKREPFRGAAADFAEVTEAHCIS